MAQKIHIAPEQVGERADQFRAQAESLKDIIETMDKYMEKLAQEWEGDSSAAFMAKFSEIRPGFVTAEEMMREIASALDKNSDRFSNADKKMAAQFQ